MSSPEEILMRELNVSSVRPGEEKCAVLIGAGDLGMRLAAVLRKAGYSILFCDPPRALELADDACNAVHALWGNGMGGCDPGTFEEDVFLPLSALPAGASLLSVQVPLTDAGPFPTRGMLTETILKRFSPACVLLNFSDPAVLASPEAFPGRIVRISM